MAQGYGIVAASAVPVALGVFLDAAGRSAAIASAGVGLAVHFGLYLGARWLGASPSLELGNPAVTATWALLASAATGLGLASRGYSDVRRAACRT